MICPRCHRELRPWLLKRADLCSPRDWYYCIRQIWNAYPQSDTPSGREGSR